MNYVCITYANGKQIKYSYFPDGLYLSYKNEGTIVGYRPLTRFETIIESILGKFRRS